MTNPQIPQKKPMVQPQQKTVVQTAPTSKGDQNTPENESPETPPSVNEGVSESKTEDVSVVEVAPSVPAASEIPEGADRAVAIVQHYINEYTAIVNKPIIMGDQLAKAAAILRDTFDFVYTQEHGEHAYKLILEWIRSEKDGLMSDRCALRGTESLSAEEWTRISMLYVVYKADALGEDRKVGRNQLEQALKSSAAYQKLQQIRKR